MAAQFVRHPRGEVRTVHTSLTRTAWRCTASTTRRKLSSPENGTM